ncbi:MAG: hypothetical protein JWQ56_3952 [Pseudarthrobacter sp.]|nr:hypothetical protein [Pseudarthrobacter sp.]
MTIPDLAVVVVHHRSFQTLPETLKRLIAEGVEPSKLLVVDNSQEPGGRQKLRSILPHGAHAIFCENAGYGAAVNLGANWHEMNTRDWKYLLVSTHEVRPYSGSLALLRAALAHDARTAVVGPVLLTGSDEQTVWSTGGYLSRLLRLPRHHGHLSARSGLSSVGTAEVSWLDGALLMSRRGILRDFPLDERFFLYMEEADHHLGLLRNGWKVKVCSEALAWQHSEGVPPYYLTRNIQLFHAKNGSSFQRRVAPPYVTIRAAARDVFRHHRTVTLGPMLRGIREGRRLASTVRSAMPSRVTVVNPLGGALSHYTSALSQHLIEAGMDVEVRSVFEPSVSGENRLRWLVKYVAQLSAAGWRSRQQCVASIVFVTWPVLGFWDLLMVRVLCGSSAVVVYHDPKPLVWSVGSSRAVSRLMNLLANRPATVVHSAEAARVMETLGLADGLNRVAHPVLIQPGLETHRPKEGTAPMRPRVRVLGQYKPDRDVDLLERLSCRLGPTCHLEIVGRDWPDVAGWRVDARFVSEGELDRLIRTSAAIVIPYTRFFQSGMAIRALEHGVPVVGRAETSLRDLYGADSQLLVSPADTITGRDVEPWVRAIEFALDQGNTEVAEAAERFHRQASRDWTRLVQSSFRSQQQGTAGDVR